MKIVSVTGASTYKPAEEAMKLSTATRLKKLQFGKKQLKLIVSMA